MSAAPEGAGGLAGEAFAPRLIAWQRQAGRHDLPWQHTRDPYRVWLSEVMLQQTQVSTVLDYYPRFLGRFPDVASLAAASSDEVLALWSGLGYYSRARNLHRCAQAVEQQHGGVFPSSSAELQRLPGIGASTAAAIAAFCFGERISILDGNVRRVLGRLLAFDGDLSQTTAQRELWQRAQQLLPEAPSHDDMVAYTQGLMDLGATLCTRARPHCEACPVRSLCQAQASGTQDQYPVRSRRVARRHESWWLLVLRVGGRGVAVAYWLERRPAPGIWAGLHSVPVFDSEAAALAQLPPDWRGGLRPLEAVAHSLTHRELRLHPLLLDLPEGQTWPAGTRGHPAGGWVEAARLPEVGLPTPVRLLLQGLPD